MADMTRRKMIKSTALTALATQLACTEEDCAQALVFHVFGILITGADASLLLLSHYWIVGLNEGQRRRIQASVPATSSLVTNAAGGPKPSTSSTSNSPTRASHYPSVRSYYLLDQLGDDQSDGRVFAMDSDGNQTSFRGEVNLRPAMPGAPGPQLRDIAVSPDGRLIVVTQAGDPQQWIFVDAASLTIAGRLMLPGLFPRRAIFSPDGRFAYGLVSNMSLDGFTQQLSVQIIDTATRTVAGTIPLQSGTSTVVSLAVTPDNGLLYASGGRFLHVIDLATRTSSGRFDVVSALGDTRPVTGTVERLTMHPSGEKLYLTLTRTASGETVRSAFIAVFDARSAQKIAEWPLFYQNGLFESRIGISPDGKLLAAGFQLGTAVQVFDTSLGEEAFRIPLDAAFRFSALAMA